MTAEVQPLQPRYLNAYVDGDKVCLLYRDDAGQMRRRAVPAEYVSYFRRADVERHARELRASRYVRGVREEGEWLRVQWTGYDARKAVDSRDGPMVRNGIQSYEGDVGPVRRFMADHDVQVGKPRRCYFDIETDSRVPIYEAVAGKARVLVWTIGTDDEQLFTGVLEADTDDAERALLSAMWAALEPFDQVLAWYGDGFDFQVIKQRTRLLGVACKDFRRWLWLDHLEVFKRMNQHSAESGDEKQSMALQAIGMAVLGEGKDDFDASKTWQAWAAGGDERARMVQYNRKDVLLLPRIEAKTGYVALFQTVCEVCNIFPETYGLQPTHQVDGFMLRMGRQQGHHFTTKHHDDSAPEGDKYAGAYVMPPKVQGITKDVHVGDFSSLYPSIILTWNMSPDTKTDVPLNGPIPPGVCRAPSTRVGFTTARQGMLPGALVKLLALRKEWSGKQASLPPGTPEWHDAGMRSVAYKVAANSFYGVQGSPFSRYYDRQIAESVTQNGVWLIRKTAELAEARGWRVIYADTDSIFVVGCTRAEFESFVRECNEQHYPRWVTDTGAQRCDIKLAYEKQFERIIFPVGSDDQPVAKRYCGRYRHYKGKDATADSKPEIKGLEYKRGDTALLARQLQFEVIQLLMQGCEAPDDFEPLLERCWAHVRDDALPVEQVRVSKSLSKPLSEYVVNDKADGTPAARQPHVELAAKLAEQGKIPTVRRGGKLDVPGGTRIAYVVTDATASPTAVQWAEEYDGNPDRYYLWESLVYPPSYRLLRGAFPAHGWDRRSKVRPRKPRGKKATAAPESPQLALTPQSALRRAPEPAHPVTVAAPAQPRQRARELVVRVPGTTAPDEMKALRALLQQHPGVRPVVLHVQAPTGVAELVLPMRVTTAPALLTALQGMFGEGCAS